eukprot:GHVQ01042204.1.p1 GENE.GHVQ01042204.1~~GHVQ01042204.1.p1  ORF type:complete len:256 (+),score=12.84 GHVQ01042204.1:1212-1979(+)
MFLHQCYVSRKLNVEFSSGSDDFSSGGLFIKAHRKLRRGMRSIADMDVDGFCLDMPVGKLGTHLHFVTGSCPLHCRHRAVPENLMMLVGRPIQVYVDLPSAEGLIYYLATQERLTIRPAPEHLRCLTLKQVPMSAHKLRNALLHVGATQVWVSGFGMKTKMCDPLAEWIIQIAGEVGAGDVDVGFNVMLGTIDDIWLVKPNMDMCRVDSWPMFASFGKGYGSLKARTAFGAIKLYPLTVHHLKCFHSSKIRVPPK